MPRQPSQLEAARSPSAAERCVLGRLRIRGGRRLHGIVHVAGAKNAALPIMAAAILADETIRLDRVPCVADVETLSSVLRRLGIDVHRSDDGILSVETVDRRAFHTGYAHVRRMRASFCVLGPLLARRGRAVVSLPGGCHIGPRPVDLHLRGLAALGADLRIERGNVVARASRLHGARIDLAGPSGTTVTGTANVMSAAVLARGVTTITSAAVEPEIVDLGRFLNRMGARIEGLGTSALRIHGVEQLGGADYRVIPDRIEAATLLLAGAITQGRVTVAGVEPDHLASVLDQLDAAGFQLDVESDRITLASCGPARPRDIVARPYPGMPTDLQAQWTALLALALGTSRVVDTVFPQRFQHLAELQRLGADVRLEGASAAIRGAGELAGAPVHATDLRAGAALVLAGLAAKGETVVSGLNHLDRGYEDLDGKLARLGAEIRREEVHGMIDHRACYAHSSAGRPQSCRPDGVADCFAG